MDTTVIEKYLDRVDPSGPPASCTVNIRNATAAIREAMIIFAGVHFSYHEDDNGTADYLAGPVRVDLGAGASTTFRASDPRRRVAAAAIGVKVRFGDRGAPNAREFKYSLLVNAPVLTRQPPIPTSLIELNVDFRTVQHALPTASDAQKWHELVLLP